VTASLLAIFAGFLGTEPALAQTAGAPVTPAGAQPSTPPETADIIVTATKRNTTLERTPISITAVSGDELVAKGVGNFINQAQETPGVSMRTNGPGQTEFEMRGLSSSGGSSPTVGFYLDDIAMTPPSLGFVGKTVVDPNLYDLNRVEVLRGPQGTLYGAGSMGGTIKLITNQPDTSGVLASGQAILSGTEGGGFNHTVNAMVNIPLSDNLAIRLVGSESHLSGWIDRIVANPFPLVGGDFSTRGNVLAAPVQAVYKNVNSTEEQGGHINARWTPTDRLTIGATFFIQHIHQNGPNNFDSPPGTLAHYQPFDIAEPYTDNFKLWAVNLNYKFDGFDVTSVTSRWNRQGTTIQDGTEVLTTYLNSVGFGLTSYNAANGGIGALKWHEIDKTSQLSQELRIASSGDTRFQWLFGLYYSDFSSYFDQGGASSGSAAIFGTNNLLTYIQPSTIKQKAAFGELSYRLVDGLKFTVGGRYFQYVSNIPTTQSGVFATGNDTFVTNLAHAKDQGFNPKFNLSYQANSNLLVYATAERGFRPGGGNLPVPAAGTPLGNACAASFAEHQPEDSYAPDTVWSYELGAKYRLGNKLTLNVAGYHERWSGIQQYVSLKCGYFYVGNLGTANVDGGEVEAKWNVTPHLLASGTFGYSHAYFVKSLLPNITGVKVGDGVQDVPLMTASGALTYSVPLNATWQASVRGSYNWTDSMTEPDVVVPNGKVPAHGFGNLRATMSNDRWTIAAFVNNIANTHTVLEGASVIVVPVASLTRLVSNQPRTAGIDISVKF